jgi:holo-[acyl-carrier protein] synthase
VFWKDMEVINLPSGQPTLHLHGGAAARMQAMLPAGKEARLHLTLTDEYPYATAIVMLEAQ